MPGQFGLKTQKAMAMTLLIPPKVVRKEENRTSSQITRLGEPDRIKSKKRQRLEDQEEEEHEDGTWRIPCRHSNERRINKCKPWTHFLVLWPNFSSQLTIATKNDSVQLEQKLNFQVNLIIILIHVFTAAHVATDIQLHSVLFWKLVL